MVISSTLFTMSVELAGHSGSTNTFDYKPIKHVSSNPSGGVFFLSRPLTIR
jgi:hypothetical protein